MKFQTKYIFLSLAAINAIQAILHVGKYVENPDQTVLAFQIALEVFLSFAWLKDYKENRY